MARNRVERRKAEKELDETEDYFRERQRLEAAKREAMQARQQRAAEEHFKAQRLSTWIKYALDSVPSDCPDEYDLDVEEAVRAELEDIPLHYSDETIRRLVEAAVARAIAPWRLEKQKQEFIVEALARMPHDAKGYSSNLSSWQIRARSESDSGIWGLLLVLRTCELSHLKRLTK